MNALVAMPLGAALGFVIGLTGVGGGVLVAPALFVILGLPYGEAIALSLIYSLLTKIVGAVQHIAQGTVLWKITLLYGLAGVPGAVVGSHVMHRVGAAGERVFPYVMAGLLFVVAGLILLQTIVRSLAVRDKPFAPDTLTPGLVIGIVVFQLIVGALLGITSVGSGSLVVLSMLFLFRMTAQQIVGSNLVVALIMVAPAGLTHLALRGTDVALLVALMVGSVVGTVIGARTALRLSARALQLLIVVLIVAGAVATVLKAGYAAR